MVTTDRLPGGRWTHCTMRLPPFQILVVLLSFFLIRVTPPYFWQCTDVRLWTVWLDMDKTDGIMLVVTLRHLLSQIMFPPTQQPLCSCFVHCSPTLLELENDKNSSDNFQAQQQQMSVTYNSLSSPSHHHPHIVVPVTSLIVKLHPRLYRLHLPPVIAVKFWSRPATTHHCFSYTWIVWFLT